MTRGWLCCWLDRGGQVGGRSGRKRAGTMGGTGTRDFVTTGEEQPPIGER